MSTFDLFYTNYPRHIGKRAAELAFERALKRGNDANVIIEAAQKFRDDPERLRADINFTPMPATWLNQDRWLDDRRHGVVERTYEALALRWESEPDERPACCRDAENGFRHWLEAHATAEEREKAKRFGVARTLGAA